MKHKITWDILNAYVDGELSTTKRAKVAKAIVNDPRLAIQVAEISEVKSTFSQVCAPGKCPNISFEKPAKKMPQRALVASIALFVITGSLFLYMLLDRSFLNNKVSGLGEMAFAELAHLVWLNEKQTQSKTNTEKILKTQASNLGLNAYIPDLSAVRLRFDGIKKIDMLSGAGLHIGYKGEHGCMVSLVIIHRTTTASNRQLQKLENSGRPVYYWQIKKIGFYLLAHRMDDKRFMKTAKVMYKLTNDRMPLDSHSILAMNRSKVSAPPCVV